MLKRLAFLAILVLGLALPGGSAAACPFDSDDCGTTSYAPVERWQIKRRILGQNSLS